MADIYTPTNSYRFTVPPTDEQGSHSGICRSYASESYRANALADYNSSRARDGLPPLSRMPRGTTYQRLTMGDMFKLYPPKYADGSC